MWTYNFTLSQVGKIFKVLRRGLTWSSLSLEIVWLLSWEWNVGSKTGSRENRGCFYSRRHKRWWLSLDATIRRGGRLANKIICWWKVPENKDTVNYYSTIWSNYFFLASKPNLSTLWPISLTASKEVSLFDQGHLADRIFSPFTFTSKSLLLYALPLCFTNKI